MGEPTQDFNALIRAAYVFELQEVEKRLGALGHKHVLLSGDQEKASNAAMETLWQRRNELLGLLWPSLDPEIKS